MADYFNMDAAVKEFGSDRNQKDDTSSNGTEAIMDPTPLTEHASFEDFTAAFRDQVAAQGRVPGSMINGGDKLGSTVMVSMHSLAWLPFELWSSEDLNLNPDKAQRSGHKGTADLFNLIYEPCSTAESILIKEYGHVDEDTARKLDLEAEGGAGGGKEKSKGGESKETATKDTPKPQGAEDSKEEHEREEGRIPTRSSASRAGAPPPSPT